MNYEKKLKDDINELTDNIQQSISNIEEWYTEEHNQIELEFGSKFDFLRLEAQKQAKISEIYHKHQLLTSITPNEQTINNELKKHWKHNTCLLLRDAKQGPHCIQPADKLVFNCPYMNRDGLKEVLYFDGTTKSHFPCKLNDQEAKT